MKKRKCSVFTTPVSLILCISFALLLSCADNGQSGGGEKAVIETAYEYFVDISKIPRCSGNEKAASDYLAAFGMGLGLYAYQDDALNVLIKKRGSKGREKEPVIILQAHIDMICRKDEDVDHDFDNDPIIPVISNGWVTSRDKTTLGADNGSGVSMIMAILASSGLSHPPIEALFTTEEELGLLGADKFDVSLLGGMRLINLDIIEEKMLVVSSKLDDGPEIIIPFEPKGLAKIAKYPDWPYKVPSPLRDKMVEAFRDFYGSEPTLAGINNRVAGVECLVFADKIPGIDMVSIGPDILDIHTPNERMDWASYNRVYGYLLKVLERL